MTTRSPRYRLWMEDLLYAASGVLELRGNAATRARQLPDRLAALADVVQFIEQELASRGLLEEVVGQDELARLRRQAGIHRAMARWEKKNAPEPEGPEA